MVYRYWLDVERMNILIFAVLLAIALILIISAEILDVTLHFPAFAIIFLLGVTLLSGNFEYKTGETVAVNYTYLPGNLSINQSIQTTTAEYSTYDGGYSHILGIIIAVIGVFGNVITWIHYGKKREKERYEWGRRIEKEI